MLIEARKCYYCGLIFRWPSDRGFDSRGYYEKTYEGQQATDLPAQHALKEAVDRNFAGTEWDKADRTRFMRLVAKGNERLLDFGCSWGYGAFQYKTAGFDAQGFELDRNRARFGHDALGVEIHSDHRFLAESRRYDLIISDHSLEHAPDPGVLLDLFGHLLDDGGKLILFVPNGSCVQARKLGVNWGPFIGESHTVAFTAEWLSRNMPRHGFTAEFYTSGGERLQAGEYLFDQGEIALVAHKVV